MYVSSSVKLTHACAGTHRARFAPVQQLPPTCCTDSNEHAARALRSFVCDGYTCRSTHTLSQCLAQCIHVCAGVCAGVCVFVSGWNLSAAWCDWFIIRFHMRRPQDKAALATLARGGYYAVEATPNLTVVSLNVNYWVGQNPAASDPASTAHKEGQSY